ncbi:N-acetylglucosamine kinase [Flavobacteriaceae bacterium (ex Bugula neritina AB1)]|nr:N-acetylglucosamine kinase [Flavobacteriaceae bacterium (ex Bugula neritina AB1)]
MILVADSGSSKCDWVLINNHGEWVDKIKTEGLNPLLLSKKNISNTIDKVQHLLNKKHDSTIDKIYFYGAGCGSSGSGNLIKDLLYTTFNQAKYIRVEEDIIAAVHATTQEPGVICILGTGANCCYFDGRRVIQKTPALGYLLADEGSGNYFGREVIKSYYLKKLPLDLEESFEKEFGADLNLLLQKLHNVDSPNKYLASFATFIFKHRQHPFIENMLHQGIAKFIDSYLLNYKEELLDSPIHFVGSIAYYAQDVIKKSLDERGFIVKSFIKKPVGHLVNNIINKNIL